MCNCFSHFIVVQLVKLFRASTADNHECSKSIAKPISFRSFDSIHLAETTFTVGHLFEFRGIGVRRLTFTFSTGKSNKKYEKNEKKLDKISIKLS